MAKPTVFISYSHQDEKWKNKLVQHLGVLAEQLSTWDDRKIAAGTDWQAEIEKAMSTATVAVFLISADFLTSKFILRKEVPPLLERRKEQGLPVIPVIARYCVWPKVGWLAPIQARPIDGKPLDSLRGSAREKALAAIAEEILGLLDATESKPPEESFLATYRRCLSATYASWDLAHAGVSQAGGAGRPIEAQLDDMYVDLRLAEGYDINKTDRPGPILPVDLLAREHPLVIRGAAGSGKTTWMRWTFRRLLKMEDAFPLMLVLRDLARRWQEPQCKGALRSLDVFLEDWVAQLLGRAFPAAVTKQLATADGPRPVLLVDGWDETGPLGKELRESLLAFMRHYPRLLVVVTSRPYGEARPSHGEGFEVLDIQPLSDAEIGELAGRFFTRCYRQEEATAATEVERFQRALSRAPEPQALARTALLLTMMLLISRSRPIPDKRHLLYEVCIENLLTAIPERKADEGALLQREQWRPDDSEERMRWVAALAFRMQNEGYRQNQRSAIVRTWEGMAALLTEAKWSERVSFLAWLAGPAGLLTDRADGTLVFAHLSFQEYLAAWHLNASVEGNEARVQEFGERLKDQSWWETLRLWAALIERQNRARLDAVLEALQARPFGASLVGAMLADGLGSTEREDFWLREYLPRFRVDSPMGDWYCAQAWGASRQDERKERLAKRIAEAGAGTLWQGWLQLQGFLGLAGMARPLFPENSLSHAIISQLEKDFYQETAVTIAAGRILCGGPPLWPIEASGLGLLQVWPSARRLIGLRLQLAVSCGAGRLDVLKLGRVFLCEANAGEGAEDAVAAGSQELAHDMARHISRYFELVRVARNRSYRFVRDFVRYFVLHFDFARDFVRARKSDFAYNVCYYFLLKSKQDPRDFARTYWRDFARTADLNIVDGDFALEFVSRANLGVSEWLLAFLQADFFSYGRVGARAELASMRKPSDLPQLVLLYEACNLSLRLADSRGLTDALAATPVALDPLWPALARHIARLSTPEDVALLTDLAQHPEHREPPLSWGLQYIVRGDVMFDDGSVLTLDDLADEVGLPHLPYLEDLPPELEIDWNAKD